MLIQVLDVLFLSCGVKLGGGGAGVGEKGQASLPHASIVLEATLQNSPFELLSNMSSAGERI